MTFAPIVLVPGFWLGAWAWDEVVSVLRDGHEVVYVDSGPATGTLDPDFAAAEKPLPSPEELAAEENLDGLSGFAELRNVTWVDLPTSHWPMRSRPRELAQIIGDVAKAHALGD
ncbi:MAG TPA: hypothetical protein VGQ15_14515 [Gaiellaceae bacterium]|nr:hypothetical protein [Gaiellaceae bacterium]